MPKIAIYLEKCETRHGQSKNAWKSSNLWVKLFFGVQVHLKTFLGELMIGMFLFLINTESSGGHKDEVASLHHKGFRPSPVCHIHYIKVIKCVTIVFIQNVCIDQHGPNSPDSRPTPLYYFQPPINVSYSTCNLCTWYSPFLQLVFLRILLVE